MTRQVLTLIVCLVWVGQGLAQAPCKQHSLFGFWITGMQTCPSVGCCPDDYCRKPCPAICSPSPCGGCDDYCRKTLPCLTIVSRCGSCDDYCRKTLPTLLCPPCSPYLRCGPCETYGTTPHRR